MAKMRSHIKWPVKSHRGRLLKWRQKHVSYLTGLATKAKFFTWPLKVCEEIICIYVNEWNRIHLFTEEDKMNERSHHCFFTWILIWKTCQTNTYQPLWYLQSLQKTSHFYFPYVFIALNTMYFQVSLLWGNFSPFLYTVHYFLEVQVYKHTLKQIHIWFWHFWDTFLFYTLICTELPLALFTSFSDVPVVLDSCIIWYLLYKTAVLCLPRGNSVATIHLLIHSSLVDYSWSTCLRMQVLVILVMITRVHQKLKRCHLFFCHMRPREQLCSVAEPWVPHADCLCCNSNFTL